MAYIPKIIKGRVKGTGWPIDGHVLMFSQWDYDNYDSWHLFGYDKKDEALDEAVMLTMYENEEIGTSLREFTEKWKAGTWESDGPFCLELDQVEVLEVVGEEQKDDTREKLLAYGIDLTPRKDNEKGGILCLPMEKNLNGDIKAKHPDWELIECPHCGRGCWKTPEADRMVAEQDVTLMCTECALEIGLVAPFRPDNTPNPAGNRAQRRRAKHGKRRR